MSYPLNIPYGSDHVLRFAVTTDNDAPIDLDEVSEIEVKVYQKKSDVLASFKLSENEVVIIATNAGTFECYLQRDSIEKIMTGRLFVQVALDYDNVDFTDGIERLIRTDILIGEIEQTA